MPDPIVNVASPAITIAVLEDDNGTAITGATWADGGSLDPDGNPWATDPSTYIENTAGNIYRLVGYTFDAVGEWLLVVTANDDPLLTSPVAITVVTDPAADLLAAPLGAYAAGTVGGAFGSLERITSSTVTVVSDVAPDQSLTIRPGSSYTGAKTLTWSADWPVDLTGATVAFIAYANDQPQLTKAASIAGDVIAVTLTSIETAGFALTTPYYEWRYELNASLGGGGSVQLTDATMVVQR